MNFLPQKLAYIKNNVYLCIEQFKQITTMAKKTIYVVCYCVTYASFIENELYTETNLYTDKRKALQALDKHVKDVLDDAAEGKLSKQEYTSGQPGDPDYEVRLTAEWDCDEYYLITLKKQMFKKSVVIE